MINMINHEECRDHRVNFDNGIFTLRTPKSHHYHNHVQRIFPVSRHFPYLKDFSVLLFLDTFGLVLDHARSEACTFCIQ